jgi:poly(3-hydroxyalkanoate) depolymerase
MRWSLEHDVVRPAPAPRAGLEQPALKIGDLELNVDVRPGNGSGRPLLVCNGIGASLHILDPLVDALDPTIEVIRFDPPGVGDSPAVPFPYGLPQMATALDELLDELGYDEVDIMGYSWGGALAQQFVLQRGSRCRNLILVSTSTGAWSVPGTPHAYREMLIPRELADAADAAVLAEFISANPGADRKRSAFTAAHQPTDLRGWLYQLSAVMWWTSLPFLPLIKQRTLVVGGVDDPIVPPANAMILAGLIPHSTLALVPGGHLEIVTSASDLGSRINTFLSDDREAAA